MCPKQNSLRAWSSLFYVVVWTVWESRNICVFEEKEVSIVYASDLVKFRVGWWFKHHGHGSQEAITSILLNISEVCVDRRKCSVCPKQVWFPPYVNGLKFNVDGSSRGKPGLAGIGGVLRNENGRVLCLFQLMLGLKTLIQRKLWLFIEPFSCVLPNQP
ncbi:hypothetical protein Ddye_021438 [Dipteronia dyeriana]|uniref:RNase H type-1 domain-containing protein n=1 Tax=Dipteronia dyeriana TaxID=168575 RepID=A0AAD9U235_9ROSI|nr:hypothetical protein Ddye_021438 [Dipteronia dyeriana]